MRKSLIYQNHCLFNISFHLKIISKVYEVRSSETTSDIPVLRVQSKQCWGSPCGDRNGTQVSCMQCAELSPTQVITLN